MWRQFSDLLCFALLSALQFPNSVHMQNLISISEQYHRGHYEHFYLTDLEIEAQSREILCLRYIVDKVLFLISYSIQINIF